MLESPDRRRRIDSQLVGEERAQPAQCAEGIRLSPEPVLGQREEPEELLAGGLVLALCGQHLRYLWCLPVIDGECRPLFHRGSPEILQSRDLGLRPRLAGEDPVGLAPPQSERSVEIVQSPHGLDGFGRGDDGFEGPRVDRGARQPQRVTGLFTDEHRGGRPRGSPRFDDAAEVRHLNL